MVQYHFAGEAGGGTPGADSEGTAAVEQKSDASAGEKADAGAKADAQKAETKLSPKEQIEALIEERDTALSEKTEIAKKLGKQSDQVGTLKRFTDKLKSNPKALLEELAKQAKVKLYFDEPNKPDLAKLLAEGTPEQQAEALQTLNTKDPRLDAVLEKLSVLDEQQMATKYADWDELGESRDVIGLSAAVGKLSLSELNHLAARGLNLPEAIEAAKKQAVEEYIDSLQTKNKGQIDGSRGRHRVTAEEAAQTFESILGPLSRV